MSPVNLDRFLKTEKQKAFGYDFTQNVEDYEAWDEVKFEEGVEYDAENTFEIKAEDMKAYAEGVMDPNPLFNDEEYAKNSPYGELVPHPLFLVQIAFWCLGTHGAGNWIRTPGSRNPGQRIELYEPFHVGEVIHLKVRPYDRYIKRRKYYLKYVLDYYNQDNVKKARWYLTLILPKTREDVLKFAKGERALEA